MKRKQGISLIVLVITIIVMIVLAGAIILTLSNNGIIDKASQAVDMTNINNVQETASLLWSDAYIGGARSETELSIQVVNGLAKIDGININDYIVTVTTSGVTVEKAKYAYYDTLKAAVDAVNNGTGGTNIEDKTNAVAGVHASNGKTYIVMFKDTKEEVIIQPEKDMTINLAGHILSTDSKFAIEVKSGCNLVIDASLAGSTIEMSNTNNTESLVRTNEGSNLTVNGGSYIGVTDGCSSDSENKNSIFSIGGIANIYNANIERYETIADRSCGINVLSTGKASVVDCNIKTTSSIGMNVGIVNWGNLTASGCNIVAILQHNSTGDYSDVTSVSYRHI